MREDWIGCKFGDIITFKNGYAFKSTGYLKSGIPVIRIGDIKENEVLIEDAICVDENEDLKEYEIVKDDILIAMSGATTGKFGRYNLNDKAYLNQRVGNIKPLSDKYIYKSFLYYLLSQLKREIERSAYGGAQPNISSKKIEELTVAFAPLPEQRAIVKKLESLFSSLDAGVADLKKAQQQLKIYRQAVLKKAFEGELTKHSKGFKITTLGSLIEKPKYGTSKKCTPEVIGKAVLRIPNIVAGKINSDELKYAEFEDSEISNLSLREGDILTIRSNGSVDIVGKCALVTKKDTNYLYAGYLIRLRPNLEKADPKFLVHCLSSHNLRVQIEFKAKSTSGVNNINAGELESLKVPLFSLEEQKEIIKQIESRLSVCDSIEQNIKESLEKAEALRQSILKKAFEGSLLTAQELAKCKQAADYQPASVLLERVKAEQKSSTLKKNI